MARKAKPVPTVETPKATVDVTAALEAALTAEPSVPAVVAPDPQSEPTPGHTVHTDAQGVVVVTRT